jgi:hypothetical protein
MLGRGKFGVRGFDMRTFGGRRLGIRSFHPGRFVVRSLEV